MLYSKALYIILTIYELHLSVIVTPNPHVLEKAPSFMETNWCLVTIIIRNHNREYIVNLANIPTRKEE